MQLTILGELFALPTIHAEGDGLPLLLNMRRHQGEDLGNRRFIRLWRPRLDEVDRGYLLPYPDWTAEGFCWTRKELEQACRTAREWLGMPQLDELGEEWH